MHQRKREVLRLSRKAFYSLSRQKVTILEEKIP